MTQIMGKEKQGLVFEIVSARIFDEADERKHVIYTLQVRHISGNDDLSPSAIERRYTHFLNLYNGLKREHPQLMADVPFPPKVILGNFDNELISTRSTGFEALLQHISSESRLRTSNCLVSFLQDVEMEKIKGLLSQKEFTLAMSTLELSFRLLNKVFTDRSPVVLFALCRLLGCSMALPGYPGAQKWGELALHRYEGVSDSDLLELYVPLLQTCILAGIKTEVLEPRLLDLKRQGVKLERLPLLEEVNLVEKKVFKVIA